MLPCLETELRAAPRANLWDRFAALESMRAIAALEPMGAIRCAALARRWPLEVCREPHASV